VACKAAWLPKHKLMQTMAQRDERYLWQGRLEIDDAFLGGGHAGMARAYFVNLPPCPIISRSTNLPEWCCLGDNSMG
jgi:hypothetical protein